MTDKPNKSNASKKKPTGDYAIGYAKPPENGKWKQGQSGNPSGKPKTPPDPDQTFMKHAMNETKVKIGDQIEQMTNFDVILLSLLQKAKKGDVKAIKIAMDRFDKAHRELMMRAAMEPEDEYSWADEQEKLFQQLEKTAKAYLNEKDEDSEM